MEEQERRACTECALNDVIALQCQHVAAALGIVRAATPLLIEEAHAGLKQSTWHRIDHWSAVTVAGGGVTLTPREAVAVAVPHMMPLVDACLMQPMTVEKAAQIGARFATYVEVKWEVADICHVHADHVRRYVGLPEAGTGRRLAAPQTIANRRWAASFNRSEHFRAIAPGDDDHKRLYGRRSDTESINRKIEDSLHLNRSPAIGEMRTHVALLARAVAMNCIALQRHKLRHQAEQAAAA